MRAQLEWDDNKNTTNIKNHDIDFCDAWRIFESPMLRKLDVRKDYGEERWVAVGSLDQITVVIVYTYRNQRIRVISIRRANSHERKTYETQCQKQDRLEKAAAS